MTLGYELSVLLTFPDVHDEIIVPRIPYSYEDIKNSNCSSFITIWVFTINVPSGNFYDLVTYDWLASPSLATLSHSTHRPHFRYNKIKLSIVN